jgi:tetratricopeptide (TPR) repeat protein
LQGEAFLSLGRYQDADGVFRGLMQSAAGDKDKLLLIGDTLKINGDLDRAKEAYQMVASQEPGNLKAQRGIQRIERVEADSKKDLRLAKALNNRRQKTSSIDFYEESLSKNPRQPEARLALAKLYEKAKAYDKASVSYQFYLGLMPNMEDKTRQKYQRKVTKLQQLHLKKQAQASSQA